MSDKQATRALVDEFFQAYNDMDIPTLERVLAPDVVWGHRNKFSGSGRDELIGSFKDIEARVPVRRFGELLRWAENGDLFVCEHQWFGVPAIDDPVWGWEKGVEFSMYAASFIVTKDGVITEWIDLG